MLRQLLAVGTAACSSRLCLAVTACLSLFYWRRHLTKAVTNGVLLTTLVSSGTGAAARRLHLSKAAANGDLLSTLVSPDTDAAAKLNSMKELAEQLKDVDVTPQGLFIQDFLSLAQEVTVPLLDVRSPGEFAAGHIPGAKNIPLFTNDQRAEVGIIYAQEGREAAMAQAIQLVSPKLAELVQEVERLAQDNGGQTKQVAIYCARGGMRSGAVGFMLRRHGYFVSVLGGGYKAYRGWVTQCWDPLVQQEECGENQEVDNQAEEEQWSSDNGKRPSSDCKGKDLDCMEATSGPGGGALVDTGKDAKVLPNTPEGQQVSSQQEGSAPHEVGKYQEIYAARLTKSEKKIAKAAQRKQDKFEAKLQREEHNVVLCRRPATKLFTPPKTSAAQWATLDPLEAMSRLRVCVVGGRTGVGKTKVLHALEALGHPVIDLEGLARHMGSTFGWCGQGDALCNYQPTTEHYGNLVAMAWRHAALKKDTPQSSFQYRWVFIEDEGRMVGKCELPTTLFTILRCAPLVVRVVVPTTARVKLLAEEYSSSKVQGSDPDRWRADMLLSIDRLAKKIGPQNITQLKVSLQNGDYEEVVRGLLPHYDKLYDIHTGGRASHGADEGPHIAHAEQALHITDRIDTDGLAQAILDHVAAHDKQA